MGQASSSPGGNGQDSKGSKGRGMSIRGSRKQGKLTFEQSEQQKRDKRQKEEEDNVMLKLTEANEELQARVKDLAMSKAEASAMKVDFSQGTMGLVDRLRSHSKGNFFKYAVISTEPPPDRAQNIDRLRTFRPKNAPTHHRFDDIPAVDMIGNYQEFSIEDIFTHQSRSEMKPYVLVSDIFVRYTPMDSFITMSNVVDFRILDMRKIRDQSIRHYPLSHNAEYAFLFALDYCFRACDLKYLKLTVSTQMNDFIEDVAWGNVKIYVNAVSYHLPVRAEMQETLGVIHVSNSDFKEFMSDPRNGDGVLTSEGMKLMRQLHAGGEIQNMMEASNDEMEMNQAKTVFMSQDNVGDGDMMTIMRSMRENALAEQRKQNLGTTSKGAEGKQGLDKGKRPMRSPSVSDYRNSMDEDTPSPPTPEEVRSEATIDIPRNGGVQASKRFVSFGGA
jgi:hypothetical protein